MFFAEFPVIAGMFTRFALAAIFLIPSCHALYVRDANGEWKPFSWVKRSNPGDILKLPLTNNHDQSYSVPVKMGTPFQEIQMAISLSQNHIAVASPDTPGQAGFYNPAGSQSFVQSSATTSISNLDGNQVAVKFAGEKCKVLDFGYNASLAITPPSAKGDLYPDGTHGVLGYGVDAAPGTPSDSTLLGVYLPPNFTAAECGIELNRAEDGVGGGLFTMGGRDTTAFVGNFTSMLVPLATSIPRPSWTIPVDKILGGVSGSIDNMVPAQSFASIDPYYPTISLPAYAVGLLYSRIPGAAVSLNDPNRYTVPCNANIQLVMTFGGKDFSIDPRDSVLREGDTCFGTVEVANNVIFKIGSPFLRNVYTTFGATVSGGNAKFTVAFADKVRRNSTGTPVSSKTANAAKSSAPSVSSH